MTNQTNELNELNESAGKPSFCYGCGQKLRNYSLLVCSECLNNECDKFANLVEVETEKTGK